MILAWLSAVFVVGVVLGGWLGLPPLALLGLAVALTLAGFLLRRRRSSRFLLLAAALSLGLGRAPHGAGTPSAHDLSYYNGRHVEVTAIVAEEPDIRDRGANYVLSANQIQVKGKTLAVAGRLIIHTPRSQLLDYGDKVSLSGRLLAPRNNQTIPYRDILAHRGIRSEMRFPKLLDRGASSRGWLDWIIPLRQHLEAGINRWLPEPEAALLIAITLGARSASLGDLAPVLVATGLIHIIAISGIKVAIVAGTVNELVRRLSRRFLALAISLTLLLFYVLLTGATASGERSALMWALLFIATYLGRATVTLVSLAFVAALMVAFDPSLLGDIGFQLSTVGTFAIVAFAPPLTRLLGKLPSPLRESLAVTLAAQIGTLPIVIVGFHTLSLSAPLANMLVLPLLPALIVLGFLLGSLAAVPVLASPLAALSYGILHAVVALASWLAGFPATVPVGSLSSLVALFYYAALLLVAFMILRRFHWAPAGQMAAHGREFAMAAVVGIALLTFPTFASAQPSHPKLYWLGSGDAMLLRTSHHNILIDGSAQPFSLLRRLGDVLPYRSRTIDLLIVTDPRASNIGALEDVLKHYPTSEVLDVGTEYPSLTYARWRADLRNRHVPVLGLRTGAEADLDGVRLTTIAPDAVYADPADSMAMLRISVVRQSLLLAGAASRREQTEAVFRSVQLPADVLISEAKDGLGHSFLHAVHPYLVMSRYHLPRGLRTHRLSDTSFSLDLSRPLTYAHQP